MRLEAALHSHRSLLLLLAESEVPWRCSLKVKGLIADTTRVMWTLSAETDNESAKFIHELGIKTEGNDLQILLDLYSAEQSHDM